jgi:hypothetical protein
MFPAKLQRRWTERNLSKNTDGFKMMNRDGQL